jgi:hypothetical protein
MGEASETIFNESIRYFLAVAASESVSESDAVSDTFKIPDTFDFKQALPKFQQKVFKKMLENFIREFEETEDLQLLPDDSLKDIRDGLNKVGNGFYLLIENNSTSKDVKMELKDVKKELEYVHPLLMEAQAFVYAAIVELAENNGKKTYDYFLLLLKCRHKMSDIKLQLRAWKIPEGTK